MEQLTYPATQRASRAMLDRISGARTAVSAGPNKWRDIMDPLKICARHFALNGTDLHLIETLMSFIPGLEIPLDGQGRHIIFASNKTIAKRMGISGDSTINRSIRKLEGRGLVTREMSPNRKRYKRVGTDGTTVRTYGIDLGPLVAARDHLATTASRIESEALELEKLRLDCSDALARLRAAASQETEVSIERNLEVTEELQRFQKILRRVPCKTLLSQTLADIREKLTLWITNRRQPHMSLRMNTVVAQSERHIEQPSKISLEKKHFPSGSSQRRNRTQIQTTYPTLTTIMSGCGSEREMLDRLDQTAAFLPNASLAWKRAKAKIGPIKAALLLGYVIENAEKIRNPGGYLHTMTKNCLPSPARIKFST